MKKRILILLLFNLFKCELYCDTEEDFLKLLPDLNNFESHKIITEDLYELKLFRVRNSLTQQKPVLLLHGILDSGDDFFVNEKNSIGKTLYDNNYDVWVANFRGNKYSCNNQQLDNEKKEFWLFSFQEMGKYDLKSLIEFIYQQTQQKISIIGHSQGTTAVFSGFSSNLELQQKVNIFIALAPIVYFKGIEDYAWYDEFLAQYDAIKILDYFNIYKLFEKSINQNFIEKYALKYFCKYFSFFCNLLLRLLVDADPEIIDISQIDRFLEHVPSRSSTQSVEHLAQFIKKYADTKLNEFSYYDYGEQKNLEKYNQKIPPQWDITKMETKTFLYYGDKDILSANESVLLIKDQLKNVELRLLPNYGHSAYFWAKDMSTLLQYILTDLEDQKKVDLL